MTTIQNSVTSSKPNVAFICVHNSCRSQMAEAIAGAVAGDAFTAYSAGTEIKDRINPDAVATILSLYATDITETQRPKLLTDIPPVDIVITMGCNVDCPFLPSGHREDWDLDDPSGKGEDAFRSTAQTILDKVIDLKLRIQKGELSGTPR